MSTITAADRERMALAMKIDTDPGSQPPGIKLHFLPDGFTLVLGIYPAADRGTVYRWDHGPEEPPTVIYWDLNGPPCS